MARTLRVTRSFQLDAQQDQMLADLMQKSGLTFTQLMRDLITNAHASLIMNQK